MLADGVEAAARSLAEPTEDRLRAVVQRVINNKFTDGQLDHCDLTLRDLHLIAKSFLQVLRGIYHQRPSYPWQQQLQSRRGDETRRSVTETSRFKVQERLNERTERMERPDASDPGGGKARPGAKQDPKDKRGQGGAARRPEPEGQGGGQGRRRQRQEQGWQREQGRQGEQGGRARRGAAPGRAQVRRPQGRAPSPSREPTDRPHPAHRGSACKSGGGHARCCRRRRAGACGGGQPGY